MSGRVSIDTGVGVSGCRGSVGIVSRSGVEVLSQGSRRGGLWERPLAGRSAAFPHTYYIWMYSPFFQPGHARKWCPVLCRVRWSGGVSGARPRHVRLRVVSRFSALQKACQNIEMAANAGVFRFCIGVVRPCGSCPAPAAGTAQRPGGSCPDPGRSRASYRLEAERFLPRGQTVPARPDGSCQAVPARPKRFLRGSCPVPARFLPGSCDRRNGSCQTAFRNREL